MTAHASHFVEKQCASRSVELLEMKLCEKKTNSDTSHFSIKKYYTLEIIVANS